MADQDDVRRIARSLPDVIEDHDRFAFGVRVKGKRKDFCWVWLERLDPKRARVPNPEVLAVRVSSLDEKEAILASDPDTFFTEPHYHRFPAVLVRLAVVDEQKLAQLLTDAWQCQAPASLVKSFDAGAPGRRDRHR
jgi:hypothetical protein